MEKQELNNLNMLINTNITNIIKDQTKKLMWNMVEYKEMQMAYTCAIKEIQTKFEILSMEFNVKHKRNPINSITSRLKGTESIIQKLLKKNLQVSLESIEKHIHDMAGIRIICSYIDDIYLIADALLKQDDIKLIDKKDYIKNPKSNGYRSLHLIVQVPVFLSNVKKELKVEVQIRTIAMDFWANLEHQIKYKKQIANQETIVEELLECANIINKTDEKMLELRKQIESAEDVQDEADALIERIKKIDTPLNKIN